MMIEHQIDRDDTGPDLLVSGLLVRLHCALNEVGIVNQHACDSLVAC